MYFLVLCSHIICQIGHPGIVSQYYQFDRDLSLDLNA